MKKAMIVLSAMLVVSAMILAGCADDAENQGTADRTYTGSGYEYRAYTDEDSASVEYLDADLDIEEAEFVRDDLDDQVYLKLHMWFTNDSSSYRADEDEDTDFYKDSLEKAFVIQAVQDDKVIEHRSKAEAESIKEQNCWELIDSGKTLQCEMYFPVKADSPVTIQVLNPDGEDTVMAELTCTPENIADDF